MRYCWPHTVTLLGCTAAVLAGPSSGGTSEAQLRHALPGVRVSADGTRIRRVYGRPLSFGATAEQSAAAFVLSHGASLGAAPDDLRPGNCFNERLIQPVMYDAATGAFKFTLVYYRQCRGGVPVFRAELRLLARNEAGFPLVLAASSLRDLGAFSVPEDTRAAPAVSAGQASAARFRPGLARFSPAELVVWAGANGATAPPRLALTFLAAGRAPDGRYEKWLFVTDAETGEFLFAEDQIVFTDVQGRVDGLATVGSKADICASVALEPMPFAWVAIEDGSSSYTDADGFFVIPHDGSDQVTVQSLISGLYFTVQDYEGLDEILALSVTPPGPADFTHNADNSSERIRAQVNAYNRANAVRAWVLAQNPDYPVIATQTAFPVVVNRTDGFCPGNAWYDGSSLNFCSAGDEFPNTAWQSVLYHEYGHHAIACGGSGQGAYGEGMSDCFSVLSVDDPVLGYGFFGDCESGLRYADNDCRYTGIGCSSCGSEIHFCGQLLSGCVWSVRNELVVTEPADYLTIVSQLTVNSILLHDGDQITPDIAIDFLTLDDDDADLSNGTPHYQEITTGFGAHDMWNFTPPEPQFPVGVLAQVGGACYATALDGDRAYVALGPSLLAFDVSGPAQPMLLGQVVLPGLIRGVTIDGPHAYVAADRSGVHVLDISDPTAPQRVGGYAATGIVNDVLVRDGLAYVANDSAGLLVLDVSDPTTPAYHGGCTLRGAAYRLVASGDFAYVATMGYGLEVVDISDPAAPLRRGGFRQGGGARGVTLSGGHYAYIAGQFYGLHVIDVAEPNTPVWKNWYHTGTYAYGVAAANDHIYFADGNAGLQIFDVSDPVTLVWLSVLDTAGRAWNVAVAGSHAYVSDEVGGLQIINVSEPTQPWREGGFDSVGSPNAVTLAGGFAYLASGSMGLQIVDVSNPARAHRIGGHETAGSASAATIVGSLAYIAAGSGGLDILDISQPQSPARVSTFETEGPAYGVAVDGPFAYVAAGLAGLQVVDVTNPAAPFARGLCDTPGSASGVAVAGGYAYVADQGRGLRVIDVTNPDAPVSLGVYQFWGYASSVRLIESLAYVAGHIGGLQIVDVSDPNAPVGIGAHYANGNVTDVAIAGHYAYSADDLAGLDVFDVTDPTRPEWAGALDTASHAVGVAVDGYVYLADQLGGLLVLRVGQAGDLNCDGIANFGDINPFVRALSDPAAWQAAYPGCPPLNGDINGDGEVDVGDINPFVRLLIDGGAPLSI